MKKIIDFVCLFVSVSAFSQSSLRLVPDSARLLVWCPLPLRILCDSNGYSFVVKGLYGRDGTLKQPEWTVNGIANGNNLVGQIIRNGEYQITFKAPVRQPVKNPVEIIAAYKDVNITGQFSDKKITGHIWVKDCVDSSSENRGGKNDTIDVNINNKNRYEVKMVASIKGGSQAAWGGIVTYSDEGSFIVSLDGEKAAITNIKNNLEVIN